MYPPSSHARPAMAEAWLAAAEVALLQIEIEACLKGDEANGERPACLRWPTDEVDKEDDRYDEYNDIENWKISTPLQRILKDTIRWQWKGTKALNVLIIHLTCGNQYEHINKLTKFSCLKFFIYFKV